MPTVTHITEIAQHRLGNKGLDTGTAANHKEITKRQRWREGFLFIYQE